MPRIRAEALRVQHRDNGVSTGTVDAATRGQPGVEATRCVPDMPHPVAALGAVRQLQLDPDTDQYAQVLGFR